MHKSLARRIVAALASLTMTVCLLEGVARLADPDTASTLAAAAVTPAV